MNTVSCTHDLSADIEAPVFKKKHKGSITMSVTVYSKPSCVQCNATYRALERQGVDFKVVDLSEDQAAFDMVRGLGYMQVPVVVAGEQHWAGFRPDMISALA